MSGKQTVEHLKSVDLFSSCTKKDLQKIARAGDEITMPAGSVIIDQGQTGREAFVVLGGTALVRRNGKKVATLAEGSIIGELSLLDHGPRTASVVCETECELFVISQRHFLGVLDEVPAIAHKLLGQMAAKIRDFDRQYYG